MFLFRMHSVGSIRPRLSVSDAMSNACERKDVIVNDAEPTPEPEKEDQIASEIQEDVVIIQEEEMVLVRKESSPLHSPVHPEVEAPQAEAPVVEESPQPKCIEPEPTMSAPVPAQAPSKPKNKKKKRK